MKQTIFLVLVAAAIVAAHRGPGMRKQMEADVVSCQASESPSQADMDSFNNNQPPSTDAGKCFVGCMFERMGFIVNGVYSRSVADAHATSHMTNNPTLLASVLKGNQLCEAEVSGETDKCVTGPKLMQCMEKILPSRPPRT